MFIKFLVFLFVVSLVAAGVWTVVKNKLPLATEQRNVVLISLTDIRADHLGTYGYSRDTSPNIDEFAKQGVLFERAFLQGVHSSISFASLFTSQYPRANGLVFDDQALSPSKTTLTEVLDKEGYRTGAFVKSSQLLRKYGITQGFSSLHEGTDDKDLLALSSVWIEENKDKPVFLFLERYDETMFHSPKPYEHYFDPGYKGILSDHSKYYFSLNSMEHPNAILPKLKAINGQAVFQQAEEKDIVLDKRDIEHLISHYDDGVRYADFFFGQALDMLKKSGIYDNSVIILVTDHGESLDDHLKRDQIRNIQLTGRAQVYDEVIRSPLIIKSPGLRPGRVSSQVQLIDLFPTILDFLNIPQNKEIRNELQGKSLVSVIEGKESEQFAYGESHLGEGLRFVRTLEWKLIRQGENVFQLYDLENDPGEMRDVIEEYPGVANLLKNKLFEWSFINLQKQAGQ